jgi:glyoxylase-like metal-dependent hydrolase (beta-lactamase superfamily II)
VLLALTLAVCAAGERVYTQGAQARPAAQGGRPAWAWQPPIPTVKPGEIDTLHVRGNVFMLIGAGGNITVQRGPEGALIVDAGTAAMSSKTLAAIRALSKEPLRYIVNTNERAEYSGGNDVLAAAGSTIPFRIASDVRVSDGRLGKDRALVISYVSVFHRMSAPTGQVAPRTEEAWPDDTYSTPQKKLYFNDEPIMIMNLPGNTDGQSIVHFRTADVIAVGDLVDLTSFPFIDLKAGGSIQAVIEGLNKLLDMTIPGRKSEGGTLIVPGHGRLSDQAEVAYYREMVSIVRDRIQDMIKRGMTLAQVKAARPAFEYEIEYGKTTGEWTTDTFIEAAYASLQKSEK